MRLHANVTFRGRGVDLRKPDIAFRQGSIDWAHEEPARVHVVGQ